MNSMMLFVSALFSRVAAAADADNDSLSASSDLCQQVNNTAFKYLGPVSPSFDRRLKLT